MSSTQSRPLPHDSLIIAEIVSLVEETIAEHRLPGFAIGIVRAGQVVYARGFGSAELETGRPVTPASLFNIASVSKSFTAIAVMQLVEQGKVELNGKVTEYLPYFRLDDSRYVDITIHHLLSHTSGLPTEPAQMLPPWKVYNYENPETDDGGLERYVRSVSGLRLLADPDGTTFVYSNVGFDILGDVIAKVFGQSYEKYMREKVLLPLGMKDSTFLLEEADKDLLVRGYRRDIATGEVTPWHLFPFNRCHTPSGGLIASVSDLSQAALSLLNGRKRHGQHIVKPQSLAAMWSPAIQTDGGGLLQKYGLGWILADADGRHFAWHVGAEIGFTANFILSPQDDVAVITLVNSFRYMRDGEPFYAMDVGNAAMNLLLGIEG